MGTDPSTGVSRYPFTFVAVVFLFAVAFVFLFFFVLRLYSILPFTGDFYLSVLYQLKYVKYKAFVGNTVHFHEVTDLAFSTLLVTGCVPQYVLRDYRHLDHDQEDLGGKPRNFSAALALGACLLFARSIGMVCLRKTPSQTLSCILFTTRKRLFRDLFRPAGISFSCRNSSVRKWRICIFLRSVRRLLFPSWNKQFVWV